MKAIFISAVVLCAAVAAFAGEANDEPIPGLPPASEASESARPNSLEEMGQMLSTLKELPVPVPLKTPFDADPEARKVYSESYRSGYRIGVTGRMIFSSPSWDTPHRDAVIKGVGDGQLAGGSEHPIHVLGNGAISVDEDCASLIREDWRQIFTSQVEIINKHAPSTPVFATSIPVFGRKEFHSLPVPVGQAILSAPAAEVIVFLEGLLAAQPDGARAKWHIATWITVANNLEGARYKGALVGRGDKEKMTWHPVYRFALPYPTR